MLESIVLCQFQRGKIELWTRDTISCFLDETKFCDFSHPHIDRIAQEITKDHVNNKDKAVSLFYWVRDNILFRVGHWRRRASKTLEEGEGCCTNKANLLVALLRANNIPAGYGVMKVHGQEYLGPIAIPMLKKFISQTSTHVYASTHLDGEWIKCDPSDDKEFCEKTHHFNPTTELVDWNGNHDAMLNLNREHILEDHYPIANIDPLINKKLRGLVRHARGIVLEVANIYIKFIRQNQHEVSSAMELQFLFKRWLRRNHPLHYYSLSFLSWVKIKRRVRQWKRH